MTTTVKDIKETLSNSKKFMEVAKAAFDSVDSDRSSSIDVTELEKVMKQIAHDFKSDPPSKDEVAEMFERLDADESGKISFDEFLILIRDVLIIMLDEKTKEEEGGYK
jgi:Ca2+-binding EF-hand superfamily protein